MKTNLRSVAVNIFMQKNAKAKECFDSQKSKKYFGFNISRTVVFCVYKMAQDFEWIFVKIGSVISVFVEFGQISPGQMLP